MKKQLLSMLCLIGIVASLQAQTLSGKLTDEQNQPLAFANVVLLSLPDSAFVTGTISDEAGAFQLPRQEKGKLIRISSVGYATVYKKVDGTDLGVIRMTSDAQLMGEVVVKGDLPKTRIKGDAMVTNVTGTVLEKAGTAEMVLDRIPGVTAKSGNVNVFGRGEAVVYINGRQVRDSGELDRLASDNIKSVEVVQSPGARYAASVRAVVRITTKKPLGDGFGFNNRFVAQYNKKWSLTEQFNFNYRKGKFDLAGTLMGKDGRSWMNQHIVQDTYLDTHWTQDMQSREKEHFQTLTGVLSLNYTFNPKHSIGVRYRYIRRPMYEGNSLSRTDVLEDGILTESTDNSNNSDLPRTTHSVNLYYSGELAGWAIDWSTDGLWGNSRTLKTADETDRMGDDSRIIRDRTLVENSLYASRLVMSRGLLGGNFSFGGEYSYTDLENTYLNESGIIANAMNEIKESSTAVFAEYSRKLGKKTQLQFGLRYESVGFDYYKNQQLSEEQSKTYRNLFPSVSLNSAIGPMQVMLAYKKDVSRPSYHQLRGNVTYNNRYTYESGNPLLRPSYTHNIQLLLAYKIYTLTTNFQRVEDDFIWSSTPYSDEQPNISLINLQNAEAYNRLSVMASAAPKFGLWSPVIATGFFAQRYTQQTPDGPRKLNRPSVFAELHNTLEFPADFTVTAIGGWYSRSDASNIRTLEDCWVFRLVLDKSFLKKSLNIQLHGEDLFNTAHSTTLTYLGSHHTMWKDIEPRGRQIQLTVRYKFNQAKNKYKGKEAGASQKARM